jgi:hypothetical protein
MRKAGAIINEDCEINRVKKVELTQLAELSLSMVAKPNKDKPI